MHGRLNHAALEIVLDNDTFANNHVKRSVRSNLTKQNEGGLTPPSLTIQDLSS
jgi:hypothetical protein